MRRTAETSPYIPVTIPNRQRDVDRSGACGATAKRVEERDTRNHGEAGRAAFQTQNADAVGDSRKAARDGVPLDINHYNLGAVIGRGGFGVVREATVARGPAKGQKVAVKIIPASTLAHPPTAHRVRQEILVHRSLDHHNVLRLLAHFRDSDSHSPSTTPASRSNVPASSSQGGNVYLVTELCPNSDLFSLLRDRGLIRTAASSPTPSKAETDRDNDRNLGMDEAEARWCAEDIVRGVAYLHGEGVIHRDLKLSNLLLGEDMHVKIGDFGLAARLDHPTAEQRTLCGTPNYISPEILSRRPYGLSSDAWSLGCLFATLLTGRPPFETSRVRNTLDKVARAEYEMPVWVSPEARDLVGRLLRKDPSSRPPVASLLEHPWFAPHLPRRSPHKGSRVPSPASYGVPRQGSQPSHHPRKSDSSKPDDSSAPSRMAPTSVRRIASAPSRAAAVSAVAATSSAGATDHDIPKSTVVTPAATRQRHGAVTAAQLGRAVYSGRTDIGSQTLTVTTSSKLTVEPLPALRTSFVNPSPEPPVQPPVVPISTNSFTRSQSGRSLPSPLPVPRPDSPPSPPPLAATLQTISALPSRNRPPPETSFSTARLRPIRQRTRHCTVEIRKGGWVVVEVEGARDGGDVEMAVCISPDWEEVAVLPSSLLRPAPPSDAPDISPDSFRPYDPLGQQALIYRPPQEAPEEVGRWVRYAGRFVGLVRGKTAKVVFYSPHAKCVLYENDPPDFSAQLHHPERHDGIAKVRVSTSAKTVAVYSSDTSMPPESFEVDMLAQSLPAVIPSHVSSLLRHTRECLRTCRDVAASAGAEARWPVVIKSSRCTPSAVSTGSSAAADRSGRQSLGGVSARVSEAGSRHGELEKGVRTRRLEGDRDSERTLGDTGSARSVIGQFGGSTASFTGELRDEKGKAKLQPDIAPAADPSVVPSRVSHASSMPSPSQRPLHLAGIGWCLRTGDGKFLMLFDDGTTLGLDAGTQSVTWRDVDGGYDEERYGISKKMPAEVKDKLKYFVQFVQSDS